MIEILEGNCLEVLPGLEAGSVQCVVTSPPYWALRDYGVDGNDWPEVTFCPMTGAGEITVPEMNCPHGLEPDLNSYVAHEVLIWREVRRVLKPDGVCWVNLGDAYQTEAGWKKTLGMDRKNLMGIPWRVALALQADGWYLRANVIWEKTNPMPETVSDRPTRVHEYVFLLSKSSRYFFNDKAIMEPVSGTAHGRGHGVNPKSKQPGANSRVNRDRDRQHLNRKKLKSKQNEHYAKNMSQMVTMRKKRSVWRVANYQYKGAHYATFPPDLVKPCVLSSTSPGDTVLDPFAGSGTTGAVCVELSRKGVMIEMNPESCEQIRERCSTTMGLALE